MTRKPVRACKLVKVQHWPEVMNDLILSRLHTPFTWGVHDCCLWVFDHVKAMTGYDAMWKHRGKYKDHLGARRIVKKNYGTVEKFMVKTAKDLNMIEVFIGKAQRGNICLIDLPVTGPALGICIGATAAFVGEKGLLFFPMSSVRRAWHF